MKKNKCIHEKLVIYKAGNINPDTGIFHLRSELLCTHCHKIIKSIKPIPEKYNYPGEFYDI